MSTEPIAVSGMRQSASPRSRLFVVVLSHVAAAIRVNFEAVLDRKFFGGKDLTDDDSCGIL